MRPAAVRAAVMGVLSVGLLGACTASVSQGQTAVATQEPKFRTGDALECDADSTAFGVLDYDSGHVGEPRPEQAAAKEVPPERLYRDELTQRRTTDATETVFFDYTDREGRLVLYLKMQQQPDGTWVVGQTAACAPYSGG